MKKVFIGIPSGEMVHADFALALAGIFSVRIPDVALALFNAKGSLITQNRNHIVSRALAHDADYILFLDTDMVLPPDTLRRLLSHNVDVVGATYRKRLPPYDLLGQALATSQQGKLQEMGYMPTGCLLIKCSVLRDARYVRPWFREVYVEGTDSDSQGEDYYFCDRVREMGVKVWCDVALTQDVGHIGSQVITIGNEVDTPLAWRFDEASNALRAKVA